jgi:hypothetical protein
VYLDVLAFVSAIIYYLTCKTFIQSANNKFHSAEWRSGSAPVRSTIHHSNNSQY